MIGTTLKVGMDTTAVTRGLGRISRGFGRFGRQVGIGAARQIGARATDMLGRVVYAVPNAIRDTADYVSGLTDMATQTGVSVNKLVELEEMFRIAGVNARDTSKAVSQLAESLYRARTESGPTKKAINALGFSAQEFKNLDVHESFFKIGEKIRDMGNHTEGVETAMKDLFGAREGFQLLRLFKDLDYSIAKAASNAKPLTEMFGADKQLATNVDAFADAMGRFEMTKRKFSLVLIDSLMKALDTNFMDELFDIIQSSDFTKALEQTVNDLAELFKMLRTEGIQAVFTTGIEKLSKLIGEGIAAGLQQSLDGTILGKLLGGGRSKETAQLNFQMLEGTVGRIESLVAKATNKLPITPAYA